MGGFFESFYMAMKALGGNKFRTVLTMLGVMIGVFAVITLVAMGEGAREYVHKQFADWGQGTAYLEIHPGKRYEPLSLYEAKLSLSDAQEMERRCSSIKYVDPRIMRSGKLMYGRNTHDIQFVMCVTNNYVKVVTQKVKTGRFFSYSEEKGRKRVVVIGKTIVDQLFGGLSPVGEKMKINGMNFTVIGITEEKGGFFGFDFDNIAFIPITVADSLFHTRRLVEIGILANDEKSINAAVSEIHDLLLKRHGKEDFRIDTQQELIDRIDTVLNVLTSIVGGIAAISLLVGGIGIMNIMLVSVTERTREVGIRKAVGARRFDIFLQFLVESIVISFLGGAVGIIFGFAGAMIMLRLYNLHLVIALWSVILALSVSIGVGVFSGVYPAMRAASLDPVEALRHE
ncbi:MAG: ABC transporter permease [Candidatus Saganbacteria bacterium]|nr:ABC transporter permease [Candidatus Saganbacteria bacterium]